VTAGSLPTSIPNVEHPRSWLWGDVVYPGLTLPLVVMLVAAIAIIAVLVVRGPVLRRLALRQVARRRTEAILIIGGSILGTALIVGSLSVGDSLNASIRGVAGRALGPIDERITTASPERGAEIAARLAPLQHDPDVDGVLTVRHDVAASVRDVAGVRKAEPITWVWDLDFAAAGRFGGGNSGLGEPAPAPGEVVINEALAGRLDAHTGDVVTFFLYGQPVQARVARIVPHWGLAGMGLGSTVNPGAFFPAGTLAAAAAAAGSPTAPLTTTLVSNRGGVEGGVTLTKTVSARMRDLLGPGLAGTAVVEAKREVLDAADRSASLMGSLFLFIGSFSIIAGVLLLMNVFVMLAEERKSQLGMLRAVGLTRRRLIGEFTIEGALYAVVSGLIGLGVGVLVGRAVVAIAARIFDQWNTRDNSLHIAFAVSRVSLINGFAGGFVIAFVTVVLTSVRLSRLNVIAAIRDLPSEGVRRVRRRWVVLSTIAAVGLTLVSVPAVAASAGAAAYVLPSLALLAAIPLLLRRFRAHAVWTGVSLAILVWAMTANLFRPAIFDSGSMTTYIVLGVLVTFSAVLLVSENQQVLLRPVRALLQRPSETALSARLALAYPTARRFRTGATLVMYSIVVFVVVLLTQIMAIMSASVRGAVADASAGWTHRVDINGSTPLSDPEVTLRSGPFAGRVRDVTPLLIASATATDPGRRRSDPLPAVAIGLPNDEATRHVLKLDKRLASFSDDAAVWRAVASDPNDVVLDAYFGSQGGPQSVAYRPGDTFVLTDPETGARQTKTIVGILAGGSAFYNIGAGEYRYPVVMGRSAVAGQFPGSRTTSFLLAAPGVDDMGLVAELQGQFVMSGVVAVSIRDWVAANFAASESFFRLMQGFLALGLFVGITGLGVVMVRAVRERRRTIGVLRALGFRATSIRRAFMAESTFVAVEGIVIGAVLAVVTTWLLYHNSAAFGGLRAPYPIAWRDIAVILGATFVGSILATLGPAHRAAEIRPAVAVRVAD
jgi:putative ABC transport system permease protein